MTGAGNGKGDAANRVPITIAVMLATIMNSLDTTIANVALPHIQGSVSASAEQITWVLTSYIVAATIMTPLTGFLADRVGRKMVFLVSIAGFTAASMLCGIAGSLVEIVLFRLLQGVFGAALIPLSQAVLLDINPPEKHGSAMAIWGAGAVLGPILGPALGGWLTDNLDWRWVFFINLPIGILAFAGVFLFLSEKKSAEKRRFGRAGLRQPGLGHRRLPDDAGPRSWPGLVRIQRDLGLSDRRRHLAVGLRRAAGHGPEAVRRPRPAGRHQLRHLLRVRLLHRHTALQRSGPAAADDAEPAGLYRWPSRVWSACRVASAPSLPCSPWAN
jgi:multidrug resistance protein